MSGGTSVLGVASPDHHSSSSSTTLSDKDAEAILLFEKAIEKESHGLMSDAVELYRKAFKINEQVDALYRASTVAHTAHKLKLEGGKNTLKKVDEDVVRRIDVDKLIASFRHNEAHAPDPNNPDHHEEMLTIKFANLAMGDTYADLKPVSPLIHLPNDVWIRILEILLITSPESWFQFSITCRKHSYLGFGTSEVWRKLANLVYPNQVYEENKFFIDNMPLLGHINYDLLPVPKDQLKILPQYNDSWKYMLNHRPFIKFLGCYISVVNYYSEGGKAEFSSSWSNPVRTITYYRYLRFYPDGTCVKVLTSIEPTKVIPHLLKYNTLGNVYPTAVDPSNKQNAHAPVKESQRIYHGRWTLNIDGDVHVEVENGSVPYYRFHYYYLIKSVGGIFKHNKLTWIKYHAIRKKMSEDDDREGEISEFSIRNEKPFKFLRVRSYRLDN